MTVAFSFQTNSVADQPLFTYSTNGVADDTVAVTSGTTSVDLTAEILGGSSIDFDDAKFTLEATVTSIEFNSAVGRFTFNLAGTFAFTTSSDELIVGGSIGDASLNVRGFDIGMDTYQIVAGESMLSFTTLGDIYTSQGAALVPLIGAQDLDGSQTLNFTVLGIDSVTGGAIQVQESVAGQVYEVLDDFNFNSSFSGVSDLVPEPASVGLGLMGVMLLVRRKKA
ncbi:PEP-CTERM sorting domain-containing protein [Planctomycetales bacterium ZRK34]|nr:PEP-CTERM sorting domain-containing protein [Planctomycetales bacterium ZRK34]